MTSAARDAESIALPFPPQTFSSELDDEVKPRVSRWIYDQCALGTIPRIATREIEFLRSLKALPFENRANRVLLYIDKRAKSSGARVRLFSDPEFFAIAESFENGEVQFILKYLHDRKYVQLLNEANGEASLTGDGYIEVDRLKEAKGDSIQGFVAMWFAPRWTQSGERGSSPPSRKRDMTDPARRDGAQQQNLRRDHRQDPPRAVCRRRLHRSEPRRLLRGRLRRGAGAPGDLHLPAAGDDREALHFDVRQFNTID